jgi:lipid A oxidase
MEDREPGVRVRARGMARGVLPGRRLAIALSAAALLCAAAPAASAEPFLDLYTGKSFTQRSDLHITQESLGNDYRFGDVTWEDRSFTDPPYYGLRLGYFLEAVPWLGVGFEYFHFKVFAATGETRPLSGAVHGAPVGGAAKIDSLVQVFQVTHGVNYMAFDVLARYGVLADRERFPRGRIQLYGGLGLGPVVTHAENRVGNVGNEDRYEVAGVGVQGFAGIRALVWKYAGVFVEYKFTHSSLNVGVASGRGRLEENTHHLIGGLAIHFPGF